MPVPNQVPSKLSLNQKKIICELGNGHKFVEREIIYCTNCGFNKTDFDLGLGVRFVESS